MVGFNKRSVATTLLGTGLGMGLAYLAMKVIPPSGIDAVAKRIQVVYLDNALSVETIPVMNYNCRDYYGTVYAVRTVSEPYKDDWQAVIDVRYNAVQAKYGFEVAKLTASALVIKYDGVVVESFPVTTRLGIGYYDTWTDPSPPL